MAALYWISVFLSESVAKAEGKHPTIANETISNRQSVMLWCNAATEQEIYTTKDLAPKGYEPCQELSRVAYCDALGDKYFGPKDTAPYGYLECALGPRIANDDGVVTRKALLNVANNENIRENRVKSIGLDPGKLLEAKTLENLISNGALTPQSIAKTLSPLLKNKNLGATEDHLDSLQATLSDLLSNQMRDTTGQKKSELAGKTKQSNKISTTNLPEDAKNLINALPDSQKGIVEKIFSGYLGYLGQLDALAAEIP